MPINQKSIQNLKPATKGEVRNTKGRGKGTPNASTVIKKWLLAGEKVKNPLTNKMEVLTQTDLITLGQLVKARKGDTAAFNALLDRAFGKPKQTVDMDLTSDGETFVPPTENGVDLSKLSKEELRTLVSLQKKIRK